MEDIPLLLIDNRNPICCRMMDFIIKNGGSNEFNFLSIYSEESKEFLSKFEFPDESNKTMILVEKGKVFLNSVAFLQSVRKLNGFIPVFYWYNYLPG